MKRLTIIAAVVIALLCSVLTYFSISSAPSYAQPSITKPLLGVARNFVVLGGSAVNNTGASVLNGDLGVSPGSAIAGFPPGLVHGAIHKTDASAMIAQDDVTNAYNTAANQSCPHDMTGTDLGGKTLISGVYCFKSSAQLTGKLTLSGGSADVFIFQIGSTLTTASNSSVVLLHGVSPCNVFWQVGSSATLGTDTRFNGNIMALASITLNTGTASSGGLYARTGAVTLDNNKITQSRCGQITPTPTPKPTKTPTHIKTPTPGITPVVGLG